MFEGFTDLGLYLICELRVIQKHLFDSVTALTDLGLAITEPAAGFIDDIEINAKVDNLAYL